MFTMTTDRTSGLIEVTASGLWTLDLLDDFALAVETAARSVALRGKRHSLLCNFTALSIQPQTVVAAAVDWVDGGRSKSRKCALYTDGVLARRQAHRLAAASDRIAVFGDRASALAWLRDDARATRPADHRYAPAPAQSVPHPASFAIHDAALADHAD
jgi:hypothetical protein